MTSKPIARLGDKDTGHNGYSPRPGDESSSNVFINGIPAHRLNDHWITHTNGTHSHDGRVSTSSSSVIINGRGAARVGDSISCGGTIAEGSPDVLVGD